MPHNGPGFDLHEEFFRLPFITKREMREGFPRNFLRPDQRLETLLENQVVEVEHTSGTSEEQTPVLFRRGWWNEQEERALRLNAVVARVLDEFPSARRATLTTPTCNGSACYTNWMSRSERTFGTTLFVNLARIPFLLKDAELARLAEEIAEWAPQFLDTDPVHAAWFAL
jgi:phenylacetate-coenzyme A ligase PaaK-like adenylate-forming protein